MVDSRYKNQEAHTNSRNLHMKMSRPSKALLVTFAFVIFDERFKNYNKS